MTRLQRAIAIRDYLVPWLHQHGQRCADIPGTFNATIGSCSVMLRTPFCREPEGRPPQTYREAMLLQAHGAALRNGLDIWCARAKVLNLEWDGDRVELVGFRSGEWEAALTAAVAEPVAA